MCTSCCIRPFTLQRKSKGALSPDLWATAHPSVMHDTFRYIEQNYYSVPNYLASIGFGLGMQQRLRQCLLKPSTPDESSS